MNTTNTAAIKRVAAINPRAFKAMHSVVGFDFEQPFTLIAIDGPYTANKLNNAIRQEMGESLNHVTVVLTRNPRSQWRKGFYLFTLRGSNVTIKCDYIGYGMETFSRKSDFDELRKSPSVEAFVFVQDRGHLKPRQEKPVDYTGRFAEAPMRRHSRWDDGRYAIDKSGYILEIRREALRRKALKLRQDREKDAYLNTDNAAKVDELRRKIAEVRLSLAAELTQANTGREVEAIADKLKWYKGLSGIMQDFERYESYTNERKFASIAESDRLYQDILNSLNAI